MGSYDYIWLLGESERAATSERPAESFEELHH